MSKQADATETGIIIPTPEELGLLYRPQLTGSSDQMTMIIRRIEAMIFNGELIPGQRLIESEMTELFGVIRGRVREALLILSGEGMIELVPQRGARVAKLEPGGIIYSLEALEAIVGKGIELFGIKYGVPSGPIANAVESAFRRIEDAAAKGSFEVNKRGVEFHVLINHLCGNPRLNVLLSKLALPLYERQLGDILVSDSQDYVVEPHREITRYLLAGQADDACASLRRHVSKLIARIQAID